MLLRSHVLRGEAAELVGSILMVGDRRRKTFRHAVQVLISALDDPAANPLVSLCARSDARASSLG